MEQRNRRRDLWVTFKYLRSKDRGKQTLVPTRNILKDFEQTLEQRNRHKFCVGLLKDLRPGAEQRETNMKDHKEVLDILQLEILEQEQTDNPS